MVGIIENLSPTLIFLYRIYFQLLAAKKKITLAILLFTVLPLLMQNLLAQELPDFCSEEKNEKKKGRLTYEVGGIHGVLAKRVGLLHSRIVIREITRMSFVLEENYIESDRSTVIGHSVNKDPQKPDLVQHEPACPFAAGGLLLLARGINRLYADSKHQLDSGTIGSLQVP